MPLRLNSKSVGPWPMNVYIVICNETQKSAIIDPGDDPESILALTEDTDVEAILITHTHADHVGALNEIKRVTGAAVYMHPKEQNYTNLPHDIDLYDGMSIRIGNSALLAIHTPGHTPGMTSFDLGTDQIIVGDTIFVGGPGRTWSPKDFHITMNTMQEIVFQWPDETRFYPGHGPSGVIGDERPAFERFLTRGWSPSLHGDVTWD